MKNVILCLCACLISALPIKPATAGENVSTINNNSEAIASYISGIYKQIDFGNCDRLPFEVFNTACHGYLNLLNAGKLNNDKGILTVCDFTKSSTQNRLWIIDLNTKRVLMNTYVAHGQGSGNEYATYFSNDADSHQSSIGFYVTGNTYMGDHGVSLKLSGMDNGFNDAAYDRSIVVHGAEYVSSGFIARKQELGRSWGCPAVPARLSKKIISMIKGGTCLFIYYPDKEYLSSAYWLNKKIDYLPESNMLPDFRTPLASDTLTSQVTASLKK
jgi:hypothetical protein